ncbi:TRAP transporter large permease subunit [bacterium]|nr:TRAP transporter large permease subunit [bacterium]
MSILILIAAFALLLAFGVPVAFAMLASSLAYIVIDGQFPLSIVLQRIAPGLDSFPLLAIPLFVLAGNLLNSSGIAQRIFDFALALVGHVRGGLGHVNILASLIFAGMSGVASADAAGLGQIELKQMKRAGYDSAFSAAVTAASSIIGPIIPPSVIMVVFAVQARVPLTDLFLAGIVPGVLLGGALMVAVYVMVLTGRVEAPVQERVGFGTLWRRFLSALPALLAPVFLLAGLFYGFATPTELGAVVVVYAVLLGFFYGEMSLSALRAALTSTVRTCGLLVFIIAAAVPFGWILAVNGVSTTLGAALAAATDSPFIILLLISAILLIGGMFIETAALLLIGIPIFLPIVLHAGIDPIHFGIVYTLTVLIGSVTPPFGIILFVMVDIAKIKLSRLCLAILPFYVPMLVILLLIIAIPQISTFVPQMLHAR